MEPAGGEHLVKSEEAVVVRRAFRRRLMDPGHSRAGEDLVVAADKQSLRCERRHLCGNREYRIVARSDVSYQACS